MEKTFLIPEVNVMVSVKLRNNPTFVILIRYFSTHIFQTVQEKLRWYIYFETFDRRCTIFST